MPRYVMTIEVEADTPREAGRLLGLLVHELDDNEEPVFFAKVETFEEWNEG